MCCGFESCPCPFCFRINFLHLRWSAWVRTCSTWTIGSWSATERWRIVNIATLRFCAKTNSRSLAQGSGCRARRVSSKMTPWRSGFRLARDYLSPPAVPSRFTPFLLLTVNKNILKCKKEKNNFRTVGTCTTSRAGFYTKMGPKENTVDLDNRALFVLASQDLPYFPGLK